MKPNTLTAQERVAFYKGKVESSGSVFLSYEIRPNRGTPVVHFVCSCGKEASITTPYLLKKPAICYSCSHAMNRISEKTVSEFLAKEGATLLRLYSDGKSRVSFSCKCGTTVDRYWNELSSSRQIAKGIRPKCPLCSRVEKKILYGPDHHNWNPEISEEERARRVERYRDARFKMWAKAVLVRQNYTCAITGQRGIDLAAHHILPWGTHPEERFSLSNGIAISKKVHKEFHWDVIGGSQVPCSGEDLVLFAKEWYGVELSLTQQT